MTQMVFFTCDGSAMDMCFYCEPAETQFKLAYNPIKFCLEKHSILAY